MLVDTVKVHKKCQLLHLKMFTADCYRLHCSAPQPYMWMYSFKNDKLQRGNSNQTHPNNFLIDKLTISFLK